MTQRNKVPATPETRQENPADPQNAVWKALEERYRPMMEECLAEHLPKADAEKIIRQTLLDLAQMLPHYRYRKEEKEAFQRYLRKVLQIRAGDSRQDKREKPAPAKRPAKKRAGGSAEESGDVLQVTEEELAVAREWFAMRDAVAEISLQELENAIPNEMHLEVFARICLGHEKPTAVAKSLGITLANAYQIKKRLLDRFRSIARALFDQVGM